MAAVTLHQLLKTMVERGGSDLHVTTNSPPQIRIDGKLVPLDMPALTAPETKQLAYSVLTDAQKHRFEENLELDLSFGIKGLARFRANIFNQRGATAAVYRQIPYEILGFKELGTSAGRRGSLREAARPRARHRPDRLGQVDDAGRDDRQDQPREAPAHHHDRRSGRVPPPAQELRRQPARAARRHAFVRQLAQVARCVRIPTWCSSARCATSRRSSPRCASPRRAT